MDREEIERCLQEVGQELQRLGVTGEIVLVGGAVHDSHHALA